MLLFHLPILISRVSNNAVLSKPRLIYAQGVLWWQLTMHRVMALVTQNCHFQRHQARLLF